MLSNFKFFNGDLSLAVSFWVFGVVGVALPFAFFAITSSQLIARVVTYPWLIFITIGVFRCADKYKGNQAYSTLSKLGMLYWHANWIWGFLNSLK